jgi:adenine-specific DNA-methyltransferase
MSSPASISPSRRTAAAPSATHSAYLLLFTCWLTSRSLHRTEMLVSSLTSPHPGSFSRSAAKTLGMPLVSGGVKPVAGRTGRRARRSSMTHALTARVALALARARVMGARYQFYLLADSREGQLKEAELARTAPSSQPVNGHIRLGFVYERVPHISLKSIANNAEIDVIWDKWQIVLEPLREKMNAALNMEWREWEIPRGAEKAWSKHTLQLHADWWQARIARQKEIDRSIAAKAEFEYLYDKPHPDPKKVRVAGPFTVESLSPHRVLGVDENDELIDAMRESGGKGSFPQMILENLKIAGVQQANPPTRLHTILPATPLLF